MKKTLSVMVIFGLMTVVGCAEKTESQKLQESMEKAQKQMAKDMKTAQNNIQKEVDSWDQK
jgi:peptidoglycan hydrolase CwlO-like protein